MLEAATGANIACRDIEEGEHLSRPAEKKKRRCVLRRGEQETTEMLFCEQCLNERGQSSFQPHVELLPHTTRKTSGGRGMKVLEKQNG